MAEKLSFRRLLRLAIAHFTAHGYDSRPELEYWMSLLRMAAEGHLGSEREAKERIAREFGTLYKKYVDDGGVVKFVPGVGRYTVSMLAPSLRAELDRRILASADLIKIHRKEAIEKTLQRFSGWATAIPAGGTGVIDKREITAHICKSLADQKFEKRRVAIDQGAKLLANISDIVAVNNGAIAGIWHDRGAHDKNYNARKVHLARDGKIFLRKDSWAHEQGLVKPASVGYMEDVEMVGQLPYCACTYEHLLSPRQLPDDMLTNKGRDWLKQSGRQAA